MAVDVCGVSGRKNLSVIDTLLISHKVQCTQSRLIMGFLSFFVQLESTSSHS